MKGKGGMLLERLIELFAPTECLACGRDGRLLCGDCLVVRRQEPSAACYNCGGSGAVAGVCPGCAPHSPLHGVSVGAYYGAEIKALVLALKFQRQRAAAQVAAELIVAALPSGLRLDVVTAVPVAPSRYRERGYNQSALIARSVARRLALPCRTLLVRTDARHQLGQGRDARLAQIRGAFYAPTPLKGERLLIVDDVLTTGATLAECARSLRAVGSGPVWAATAARH